MFHKKGFLVNGDFMLIAFRVKNYRSFKDEAEFSMVAAKLSAKNQIIDDQNVFDADKGLKLLKSAVIYGANASGKSNLIKAMATLRNIVLGSASEARASAPVPVESFKLNTETERQPSEFEITFLCDGRRFRYGFVSDREKIHNEWLYHVPNKREARLFERENQEFVISDKFREGRGLEGKTRENALFLSVVSQFNGSVSRSIIEWFEKLGISEGINDWTFQSFTIERMKDEKWRLRILDFIKSIDVGITNINVDKKDNVKDLDLPENMPSELKTILENNLLHSIQTVHKKFDNSGEAVSEESFDILRNESAGTQKAVFLAGPLFEALKSAKVLVIDELDARLHPMITESILGLFNSRQTNPNNAQLIFASHDVSLLDKKYFRRDQIWFADKDSVGATELYSLAEIKERNDAAFHSRYLQGKYGGIPYVNFFRLIEE